MQRLEGPVSDLEHERHVLRPARDRLPESALHVYRFTVDGVAVELRHRAAVPLNEGDRVAVACAGGAPARVYAFANRTWGATLVEPPGVTAAMRGWLPALLAAIAVVAAVAGLGATGWAARAGGVLAAAAALLLLRSAVRGFREYTRYRRAARALEA